MSKLRLMMIFIPMVIFSPLAIDIFLPALPEMASNMSTSMISMQWTITCFILSLGIGQLIFGPLSDRFGRRPIALGGIIVYGISALLMSMIHQFEWHIALRFLQGIGACSIVVTAYSSVRDRLNTTESSAVYSYLNGAICCIPALAPVLGYHLSRDFGWESTFLFMAGFAVISGLLIYFTFDESRPATSTSNSQSISFANYRAVLAESKFTFHAILVMLAMSIILAYVSSAPALLMDKLGLSQEDFTFWFSVNAVVCIVASIIVPHIAKNLGVKRAIELGLVLLMGVGGLLIVQETITSAVNYMIPVIVSSIGFSLLMGVCTGQALSPFKHTAGTAAAVLGFIQMSGAALLVTFIQAMGFGASEQLILLSILVLCTYIYWKIPRFNRKILAHN
ncbi:Bcr/CflA family efflux MFS transporter [Parashewanella spongiae]|uniref:Bcr/CflA family efflux transporter n=1 Tax=Parashewanella spongiae TaxID=342950 RepID=A0A3A6TW03_9GAMM|nr:multidrug effflux MFS transporter [Parashewanella spongiae]MCL1076651.1 multidrug effflux MFS transporter [Parashewanella spongiae]RJY12423.1 Bcr/CflA family efflux MFS transporter [Parashewanella spongiae]